MASDINEIRKKYELGEYRDTSLIDKAKDYPKLPCNVEQLKLYAGDINIMSAGKIALRLKSRKSRNWLLFVDGQLVQELRNARAMSFMDGWMASARFNK